MGKLAATEVLAGAEGAGARRVVDGLSDALKLELVTSPMRKRIIDGMLEVVGGGGYEAASVQAVLDHTGVYRQAFYDNFRDKDDCYLQAYDVGVTRIQALAAAAATRESDWRGRLRAGLGAALGYLEVEPDVGRALVVEVHASGPEALSKRGEAIRRFTDFVELGRLETDQEEAPSVTAEAIVSGIHAVVHSRLSSRRDELRSLLPEFMYFAVLPYFGTEAASAEMAAARA